MALKNKYINNYYVRVSKGNKNCRCHKKHFWRVWRSHCINLNVKDDTQTSNAIILMLRTSFVLAVNDDSICASCCKSTNFNGGDCTKSLNINNLIYRRLRKLIYVLKFDVLPHWEKKKQNRLLLRCEFLLGTKKTKLF